MSRLSDILGARAQLNKALRSKRKDAPGKPKPAKPGDKFILIPRKWPFWSN